jgi:NADH-quinone oxidoreductase subunit L
VPLILLAIPSICAGWVIGDVVFGDYFGSSIYIAAAHPAVAELAAEFHGVVPMMLHGFHGLPFWLAFAGAACAWFLYILRPDLPAVVRQRLRYVVAILDDKYGFDRFNDWFFAGGARLFGTGLWQRGDVGVIDGIFVNGSARAVGWTASVLRYFQSGYIYHYAFAMIIGVLLLLSVLLVWPQ